MVCLCVRAVRPDQPAGSIRSGPAAIVSWVAQTFLQLVLLSVIIVGQNVQAAAADKRAEATFHDASATLHEMAHVQGHLAAQDVLLTRIAERIGLDPVPIIDNPAEEDSRANPGRLTSRSSAGPARPRVHRGAEEPRASRRAGR